MKNLIRFGVLTLIFMMTFAICFAEDNALDPELSVTMLNQDPDPAIAGDYVELRFQVEKPDSPTLTDLSFEFLDEYPFSFDDSDSSVKTVESWTGSGDSKNTEYYVLYYKVRIADDAIEGDYDIKLRYNYTKGVIVSSITREFNLRIGDETNENLVVGGVVTNPVKLLPDSEENSVTVLLLNLGSKKAENVLLTLGLPDGFSSSYSYSNIANVGNIEGDSSAQATFYLDLDETLREGQFPTVLNVQYKGVDDNFYTTASLPLVLDVKEKPIFNMSFDEVKVIAGEETELKVDVTNIGTKKAESISVRAFKDSTQPFDFDEKSDFIGTLDSNEEGTAVLKFSVDAAAVGKKYMLDVQIRSIKNDQVFLQEGVIPIVVEEQKGNGSLIKGILGAVLVLILIAGAYFYGKSKA